MASNLKVMKKIYLLLLLAIVSSNLFCQQDNLIVHDSTYIFDWDFKTNDWVVSQLWVYVYDAKGNRTENVEYLWDSQTNDWIFDRRVVFKYDSNGNLTEDIAYAWDSDINEWVNYITVWLNYRYVRSGLDRHVCRKRLLCLP